LFLFFCLSFLSLFLIFLYFSVSFSYLPFTIINLLLPFLHSLHSKISRRPVNHLLDRLILGLVSQSVNQGLLEGSTVVRAASLRILDLGELMRYEIRTPSIQYVIKPFVSPATGATIALVPLYRSIWDASYRNVEM
jgi:hypothetical protein